MAGVLVDLDKKAVGLKTSPGDVEAPGKERAVFKEHTVDVATDDGFVRAGKPGVGEVGGATGEDLVIGCLDVGVGADDDGDFAIERAAHGNLFGSGFAMEVNKDAGCFRTQLGYFRFDNKEGVVGLRPHEGAAQGVDDAEFLAVAADDDRAAAGGAGRVVDGAQEARLGVEVGVDFLLIPSVVAESDNVSPGTHQVDAEFGGDAISAGRIFAVHDKEIGSVLRLEGGDGGTNDIAAGFAHDVTKKNHFHQAIHTVGWRGRGQSQILDFKFEIMPDFRILTRMDIRCGLLLAGLAWSGMMLHAQETPPAEVTAEQVNKALQIELFSSAPVWEEDAETVAQRLQWPRESKTSTQGSYRLYAGDSVRILGARPYSCALYAEEGKAAQFSIVFANKGDFGKFASLKDDGSDNRRNEARQEREQKRAIKEETRNFEQALKADAEAIEKALTDVLGPSSDRATFGQSREMRERVTRWNWKDTAILLATPRNEYVIVRVMPAATADAGGRVAKISDADLRQLLLKRVEKRPNGDVLVTEIPMVDQGPKGFCVPATWERYLRYVNIPADMYVLAMAGGTSLGGGTYLGVMAQNVDDLCRQYGRRIEGIAPGMDVRNISKHIDEGLPIMWACFVVEPLELSLIKRMHERRKVTDWEAWTKSLEPYRAAAKKIQPDIRSGHLRMIIGYNAETKEIAISDSWGERAAERWMTVEEAAATSQGVLSIIRW